MDICATFRLTGREYRHATRNLPTIRAMFVICALMVALGLLSLLSRTPATLLFYVGLGLPVIIEVAIRLAERRSASLLAQPWTVRITDEMFALQTGVSQAEVSLNAYREAWERSRFWYLRQVTGAVSFVPKRVLNGAQQAELAEFLARRLPPPKIRWYSPRSWR